MNERAAASLPGIPTIIAMLVVLVLVAGWVFDMLGAGRLQARTSLGNVASEHVLERCGFTCEGVARAGFVLPVSREWVDTTMWSLLPGEAR